MYHFRSCTHRVIVRLAFLDRSLSEAQRASADGEHQTTAVTRSRQLAHLRHLDEQCVILPRYEICNTKHKTLEEDVDDLSLSGNCISTADRLVDISR